MKLDSAAITFLVGSDSTTIQIHDQNANVGFVRIRLTNSQLAAMLSRLSFTPCEVEVFGLDRVGKKMENRDFEFEISEEAGRNRALLPDICSDAMQSEGLSEWVSDMYFNSQNTFFKKGGKSMARTTIRRWV